MAPQRAGRDITKQMLRHRPMVLDQMDFKQKAEEKKMSMSKNIARLAVTAGLTAALSFGGVMAPVTMAFAEGGQGSITISQVEGNESTTFKAYQIFKAKVVDEDDKGKVASDIKWANNTVGSKVIAAIQDSDEYKKLMEENDTKKLDENATAQVVAEWLSQNVTGTSAGTATTGGTRVASGGVLNSIAKAVAKDEAAVGSSFKAGEKWARPADSGDGYYLFVSDDLTDTSKPNTGTSPIFAIVGGDPVTVTEKTSIPKVDKKILDDTADKTAANATTDDWKNVGDAWIGQEIDYKLTGTVADNIASYDTYQYEFQDHLSIGLDAELSSVAVTIGGILISPSTTEQPTNGYTAKLTDTKDESENVTGHDLTIFFADLKAAARAAGVALNEKSEVVVTYKAKLTKKAEYTADGNTNEVKLVYSNNPMSNGTGTSTSKRVTDHVFGLDVTKVDKDSGTALKGENLKATFQVKMTKEGEKELKKVKWLTEDGGFTEDENAAGKFETNKDKGKVFIPGLVEGTYEISETGVPSGYNSIAPFQIAVKPTYDKNGVLTGLSVTEPSDMVTLGTATGAIMPVTIQNKKGSGLPLTGLNGVTFTWIAGGAVLCIGVAHLIRSRKQAEESEQE